MIEIIGRSLACRFILSPQLFRSLLSPFSIAWRWFYLVLVVVFLEFTIWYTLLFLSISSNILLILAINTFRPLSQSMEVLHMWGKSPNRSVTFQVMCQNFVSQFPRDLFHWSKRLRCLSIAYATSTIEKSIYDYTLKVIDGKGVPLNKFKGKVLLIVNVASRLNQKILDFFFAFEILTFPCNQFGGQEPGSNSDIKQFACTREKVEFPIFDKSFDR